MTPVLDTTELDAVIFDMDGVVTDTARTHSAAWKRVFDEFLEAHAERTGEPFTPFDERRDYHRYVDGKSRYDGARSFIESRGIVLPYGSPTDPPGTETICGIANRKDECFLEVLDRDGAHPYTSTVRVIEQLRSGGIGTAIISASRNMEQVVSSAGVAALFDTKVDGIDAAELGLPGKPDPAVFLEAARRLGVEPDRAAVVEDAQAGVQAGRAGGFHLVLGVDRGDNADALREAGAHVVVNDLGEVTVKARPER
jgi:trehalose 6-phosphate phosphatase